MHYTSHFIAVAGCPGVSALRVYAWHRRVVGFQYHLCTRRMRQLYCMHVGNQQEDGHLLRTYAGVQYCSHDR